jgi:hypothetical protein
MQKVCSGQNSDPKGSGKKKVDLEKLTKRNDVAQLCNIIWPKGQVLGLAYYFSLQVFCVCCDMQINSGIRIWSLTSCLASAHISSGSILDCQQVTKSEGDASGLQACSNPQVLCSFRILAHSVFAISTWNRICATSSNLFRKIQNQIS